MYTHIHRFICKSDFPHKLHDRVLLVRLRWRTDIGDRTKYGFFSQNIIFTTKRGSVLHISNTSGLLVELH